MAAAVEGLLNKSHQFKNLIVNTELRKAYTNTALQYIVKLTCQESDRGKLFDAIFK